MILRAVRRRRRLTQSELARLAGVSQQSVSSLECGLADRATLRRIREVSAPLGITVDLVLRWKGPDLDALVDARHARLVKQVVARLGFRMGDRGGVRLQRIRRPRVRRRPCLARANAGTASCRGEIRAGQPRIHASLDGSQGTGRARCHRSRARLADEVAGFCPRTAGRIDGPSSRRPDERGLRCRSSGEDHRSPPVAPRAGWATPRCLVSRRYAPRACCTQSGQRGACVPSEGRPGSRSRRGGDRPSEGGGAAQNGRPRVQHPRQTWMTADRAIHAGYV